MSNELLNYLVNYAIKGLIVLCFFGFRSIRRRNIESSGAIGGQNIVQIKCPNKMSNLTILKVWKNGKPNWKYCKALKNLNLKMWKSGEIAKIGGNNVEILQNLEKSQFENVKVWRNCKNVPSKVGKVEKGQKIDIYDLLIYSFIYLFIYFLFLIYN